MVRHKCIEWLGFLQGFLGISRKLYYNYNNYYNTVTHPEAKMQGFRYSPSLNYTYILTYTYQSSMFPYIHTLYSATRSLYKTTVKTIYRENHTCIIEVA